MAAPSLAPRLLSHQRSAQLRCPSLTAEHLRSLSTSRLWDYHEAGRQAFEAGELLFDLEPISLFTDVPDHEATVSWLDLKRTLAYRHLQRCDFCVHHCGVNRTQEEQGYCQLGADSPYSGAYVHWGEEAPIRPTYAVFWGGCTMHCVYCHNWRDTFETQNQATLEPRLWLQMLRQQQGNYRTLSFIGGTSEPHLHTLLDCLVELAQVPELAAPVVLNHNATLSSVGLQLMEGVIDVYLPDYKHGNNRCAWQLTKIAHYQETLQANLAAYRRQDVGLLIRHLPIPGHLSCCTYPVLAWLSEHYPEVTVNVMLNYQPMYKAEGLPEINRCLTPEDEAQIQTWITHFNLRTLPF